MWSSPRASTRPSTNDVVNGYGVGHDVDVTQPFLMVIQHPVTTEADNRQHLEATLRAIASLNMPTFWFWPNPDAGTGEMADRIRHFRERGEPGTDRMRFITNVPADEFVALLKAAACLVGNSSAGIKECSYLGTPVVNIGLRQQGRLHGDHVVHAPYDSDAIAAKVRAQLVHGRYAPSTIYYQPDTSHTIAEHLVSLELYTQKRFHDVAGAGA